MERYSYLISHINRSGHFLWEHKGRKVVNEQFVSVYVVYFKDGNVKVFTTFCPCGPDVTFVISDVDMLNEQKIVDYLKKKGFFPGQAASFSFVAQLKEKSFANRRNVDYECHSHQVRKEGDVFHCTYTIIAKIGDGKKDYIVQSTGKTTLTDGANKGKAIRLARKAAEVEMTKYNLGPIRR